MFKELFGRRSIDKKIEKNLIELFRIPTRYFEALYVECSTEIAHHILDLCEEEEKERRGELTVLLKERIADIKIEIAKYELFERLMITNKSSNKSSNTYIYYLDL